MRCLVFALLLLCAGSQARATPNYQCIADCAGQGNRMSFCQSRCAYQNPSLIPRSPPMLVPLVVNQRSMGYQCLAGCKAQSLEEGYCKTVCAR